MRGIAGALCLLISFCIVMPALAGQPGENDEADVKGQRVHVLEVSPQTQLWTYYPCTDVSCQAVDVFFSKQTVVVNGIEHVVSEGELVVTRVFDLHGRVFVFLDNNHSFFICEFCSDGHLDYLAEAKELSGTEIEDVHISEDPPFMTILVQHDPGTSSGDKTFRRELLMANAWKRCKPAVVLQENSSTAKTPSAENRGPKTENETPERQE